MGELRETVLITGASSGIGEALASVCANNGCDLILVARSADKLEAMAAALSRQYGVSVTARPSDLSAPGSVSALCSALHADGQQVDMLVNNAGVLEHGSFISTAAEDHQRIVALNVAAHTAMLAHLLPAMVERGSGRILNVASLGAFQPLPSVATYAATKAFVLSLSEALAEEVRGTGVTVTALCPGLTATGMMERAQNNSEALLKIPELLVSDVDTVARKAFRACRRGDAIVVPGARNLAASLLSRITPKWLVRRITGIVGRATFHR